METLSELTLGNDQPRASRIRLIRTDPETAHVRENVEEEPARSSYTQSAQMCMAHLHGFTSSVQNSTDKATKTCRSSEKTKLCNLISSIGKGEKLVYSAFDYAREEAHFHYSGFVNNQNC